MTQKQRLIYQKQYQYAISESMGSSIGYQFDKVKRIFFPADVESILIYGFTTWTLTKRKEKKFDDDCTRMLLALFVSYWPSTEPSIKRCTCVNNRKNSGSRWAWYNNITRCSGRFESVGGKMPTWQPAADRGLWALSDAGLSNPAKMRKKCCYCQKNIGSI